MCLVAMPTTKGRGRTRGARLRARMSSVNPGSTKRQRLRHPDRASRTALPHSGGTIDDIDLADVDAMVASAQDAVREVRARAAAARKAGAGKGPRRSFQMPHPSVTVAPSALSAYAAGSVALLDLDGNSTLRHNPRHAYVRFTSRKSLRVFTSLSALYARSHNPADEPLSEKCFMQHPLDFVETEQAVVDRNGKLTKVQNPVFVSEGTTPPGSQWAMIPIPTNALGPRCLPGPNDTATTPHACQPWESKLVAKGLNFFGKNA